MVLEIAGRKVGAGHPAYIVAELSANHGQSFQRAAELVRAAKAAGADAVKVQTYTPDTMTIPSSQWPFRIQGTPWSGRTLYELYSEAFMPWEWQPELKKLTEQLGMHFFSTPFDPSAVSFLESLDVPAFKIASFELVDLALLRRVAQTAKPVILSTGMATLAEIDEAVRTLRDGGATDLALLKCTSAYPSPPEEMNLRSIPYLAAVFGTPVGLSDHTLGTAVPVAAVALGACIIEKHLTLSREEPGPDSAFSLEPHEFRDMVEAVRTAEKALGEVYFGLTERERESRVFRRSLFVVRDVREGERLTPENVRAIRPGYGLHPRHWHDVIGQYAARDIPAGTPLSWNLVSAAPPTLRDAESGER